jgi:hypothetical protein
MKIRLKRVRPRGVTHQNTNAMATTNRTPAANIKISAASRPLMNRMGTLQCPTHHTRSLVGYSAGHGEIMKLPRRAVYPWHPFDGDAGVDPKRVPRSLRPSRRRSSDGICFRRRVSFRNSAANVSNEGSTSLASAWQRISRCSASVERPCRDARRFKRAIRSSSKFRTCRFPAIGDTL